MYTIDYPTRLYKYLYSDTLAGTNTPSPSIPHFFPLNYAPQTVRRPGAFSAGSHRQTRRSARGSAWRGAASRSIIRGSHVNRSRLIDRPAGDDRRVPPARTVASATRELAAPRGPPTSRPDSLFGKSAALGRGCLLRLGLLTTRSAKGTPSSTTAGYLSALPFTNGRLSLSASPRGDIDRRCLRFLASRLLSLAAASRSGVARGGLFFYAISNFVCFPQFRPLPPTLRPLLAGLFPWESCSSRGRNVA